MTAAQGRVLFEMKGIGKSFPGVKALQGVNLTVREGQVHALLGENGAGKSTLIKILSGAYTKDEGQIYFEGNPVEIRNPQDAEALGISCQEPNSCRKYLSWAFANQRLCGRLGLGQGSLPRDSRFARRCHSGRYADIDAFGCRAATR